MMIKGLRAGVRVNHLRKIRRLIDIDIDEPAGVMYIKELPKQSTGSRVLLLPLPPHGNRRMGSFPRI